MHISDAVLNAGAARFDLDPAQLQKIERGGAPDGVVYNYADQFIVKFLPITPEKLVQLRDKLAFIDYLAAHGMNVPQPILSPAGEPVEVVEDDTGADHTWAVTKVVKAPGSHLQPTEWDSRFFKAWGRVVGRMHTLTAQYDRTDSIITWRDEHAFFANMCQDDAVGARWAEIGATLAELPEEPGAFGLIHNDLHAWNLLVAHPNYQEPDAITVLDFDVCAHHWFALDIAIALFHPLWEARNRPQPGRDRFIQEFPRAWLAGYAEEYTLSEAWLARLPLFARYRQILFFVVMTPGDPDSVENNPWLRRTLHDLRQSILYDVPLPGLAL